MELATLEAYSATKAVLSRGYELYVEDPAVPASFVRVGLVTEMPSLADGEPENINVTNNSSRVQEFINGLADPTSVDANFVCDMDIEDAGQIICEQARVDDKANGTETILNFEARFPVNDSAGGARAVGEFSAKVIDSDFTTGVNQQMVYNVTLRKTSEYTTRSWITPAV